MFRRIIHNSIMRNTIYRSNKFVYLHSSPNNDKTNSSEIILESKFNCPHKNIDTPTYIDNSFLNKKKEINHESQESLQIQENLNTACCIGDIDTVRHIFTMYGHLITDMEKPIIMSCKYGHGNILRFLHSRGGDIYTRNNTCFKIATNDDVISYLDTHGKYKGILCENQKENNPKTPEEPNLIPLYIASFIAGGFIFSKF